MSIFFSSGFFYKGYFGGIIKINLLILIFYFIPLEGQEDYYNKQFCISSNYYAGDILFPRKPSIETLDNGRFISCWIGKSQSGYIVSAQIYQADGKTVGPEIVIDYPERCNRWNPTCISLQNGGFVLLWENSTFESTSNISGLYAQIFDTTGNKKSAPFRVNTHPLGIYANTGHGCPVSDHEFLIIWYAWIESSSTEFLFGQVFDENGKKVGDQFEIRDVHLAYKGEIDLCVLSNGNFFICLERDDAKLYGFILNKSGVVIKEVFQINSDAYSAEEPKISLLNNGQFIVTYTIHTQDNFNVAEIAGQVFNGDGSKIRYEFIINSKSLYHQRLSNICQWKDDGFIVSWSTQMENGGYEEIHCQIFNDYKTMLGPEFQVNIDIEGPQVYSDICSISEKGFALCWASFNRDYFGIYGKIYCDPIIHTLNDFNLISPLEAQKFDSTLIDFSWQQASNTRVNLPHELKYDLYLAQEENFTSFQLFHDIYDSTFQTDELEYGNTYFWKVCAKNIAGDSLWCTDIRTLTISNNTSDIDENDFSVNHFTLYPNYPNPFNPSTQIQYDLPQPVEVLISIYNVNGKLVETLVQAKQAAGSHKITWQADEHPSGTYFIRMQADAFEQTRKCLLIK